MARKLFTIEEAAQYLGVSPESLGTMRERGEVHAYRDGGTWKFREDELERVAADRADGGEGVGAFGLADEPDSVLLSEQALGQSSDSTGSTIIGKSDKPGSGRASSAAESDLQLAGDEPAAQTASKAPAAKGPAAKGGPSKVGDAFETLDFELALDENQPASSKSRATAGADSALDLTDDEDLVLGGTADSDITRGAGDSGISLAAPSDSGISLEEPLEIGGSSVDSFELGDDQALTLGEEKASAESPTQVRAEDDFLLTPMVGEDEEEDSGSQVIALDEDDVFAAPTAAGGAELELEDADGEDDAGAPAAEGMVSPVAASMAIEAPYSIWNVLSLVCCVMFLMLSSMFMYDLIRNMWSWDQAYNVNSGMMDTISGWFISKK